MRRDLRGLVGPPATLSGYPGLCDRVNLWPKHGNTTGCIVRLFIFGFFFHSSLTYGGYDLLGLHLGNVVVMIKLHGK